MEFLDKLHPYAIDLDIFGPGSLFECVNTAQTQTGRARLAQWLLQRADPAEIAARQAAVAELRDKFGLREEVAARSGDARAHIHTDTLLTWAAQPRNATNAAVRAAAFCLPIVSWSLFIAGRGEWFVLAFAAQGALARAFSPRTKKTLAAMKLPAPGLRWLSEILGRMERENFRQPRLVQLQSQWKGKDFSASASLRKLERLVDWMDSRANMIFAAIGPFFLVNTQFAFAMEAWRERFGPRLEEWLVALGEMEALASLGGYACEHPADVFPEWARVVVGPLIEAEGLAHPLLPESSGVRNNLALGMAQPAHVISGSNMSGKSTWLRAIGTNLVLAMAGAPVRAARFRMTPLQIGASIRTMDSLQEGVSRFYAEITRLRQIVQLTEQRQPQLETAASRQPDPLAPPSGERGSFDPSGAVSKCAHQNQPVIFLIDEVLSGTNSHDRRIGAAAIVKGLVARGAIGLITTHDLALTQIVDEFQPPARISISRTKWRTAG